MCATTTTTTTKCLRSQWNYFFPKWSLISKIISVRIINESKFLIFDYLANSFNESLKTKSYPDVLKIDTVIPLHKTDPHLKRVTTGSFQYCPQLIKSLKQFCANDSINVENKLNYLSTEFQFGFKTKYSINHAIYPAFIKPYSKN